MTELLHQPDLERAAAPVQRSPTASPHDRDDRKPEEGIALCLSGGGYRAMVFHLGALWRLNETGYLHKLARVSSVSGGSITAGVLALNWDRLDFDDAGIARNFDEQIVVPVRSMARRTIDWQAILLGTLLPGSAGGRLTAAYRKYLFGSTTLQQIPSSPEFVFNATNLQSGALWRFSKPYLWDYRVGEVKSPTVELAVAVAASSAFPPFLSPVVLDLDDAAYVPGSGDEPGTNGNLQHPPFTTRVVLADGGVYDNLGLETAWKRYTSVLVSDGGGHLGDQPRPRHDLAPAGLPRPRRDRQPGAQPAQATADRRLSRRPARGNLLGHPERHRRLRPPDLAPVPGRGDDEARRDLHPAREPRPRLAGTARQLGVRDRGHGSP